MDPGPIAVRCLFAYLVLLALLRSSGKRTVAEGAAFDFVLALVIGDLVDDLLWAEVSAATFVAAAGSLVVAHGAIGLVSERSETFRRWVAGQPSLLVGGGARRGDALRREHVHEKDLAAMLRQAGVERWADAETVVLEDSGHPSVVRAPAARPLARRHLARLARRRRKR